MESWKLQKYENTENMTITEIFQHQNLLIIESFAVTEVVQTSDNC